MYLLLLNITLSVELVTSRVYMMTTISRVCACRSPVVSAVLSHAHGARASAAVAVHRV